MEVTLKSDWLSKVHKFAIYTFALFEREIASLGQKCRAQDLGDYQTMV